ncbi:hypothetical protein KY361_05025 [Candidatus Woesearchaeota archaeon]|nr:hypothetical protein [Candidatus Woesearchaeota archaeon]
MPKKTSEKAVKEHLKRKEDELDKLREDNLALLKAALKQTEINKELKEGIEKITEINRKLSERLKKKSKSSKK